jgi:hypothetical protein
MKNIPAIFLIIIILLALSLAFAMILGGAQTLPELFALTRSQIRVLIQNIQSGIPDIRLSLCLAGLVGVALAIVLIDRLFKNLFNIGGWFGKVWRFINEAYNRLSHIVWIIFNTFWNFVKLTAVVVFVVVAVWYYSDPFYAVWTALEDTRVPAQYHSFRGWVVFFVVVTAMVAAGFVLMAIMTRLFTKTIMAFLSLRSRQVVWVLAYLLWGVSLVVTAALFNKLSGLMFFIFVFVLGPIVATLTYLVLEESRSP